MMMALRVLAPPPLPSFPTKLEPPSCSRTLVHYRNCPVAASCSMKLSTFDWFRDPKKINLHLNYAREKVWNMIPSSVKEFPWKKAEAIALHHLLDRVPDVLKWPLFTIFILTFVSDVLYSFALNKELLIPFGLFLGCTITNFFKEALQEMFPPVKERDQLWQILGIGCFYLLGKLVSAYLNVAGRVFLLNAANGGFMQIFWLWRTLLHEQNGDEGVNSMLDDTQTAVKAENDQI